VQPPHSCFCSFLSSSIVPFTCTCGAAHLRSANGPVMHVGVHARTFHSQCAVEAPSRLSRMLPASGPAPTMHFHFYPPECTLLRQCDTRE
jgi:hypothetical protein